ncbi:hypothetical protein B0O80DRAFT_482696 [Mortierella sp. GBAus27b]|nr:hypothetical protein BGX31_011197 [Mortierella sp. GBA43]KAI8363659.1 hypothetical protein B0O80DRAFT_482696 [Mortierella sp. GBAus27b]
MSVGILRATRFLLVFTSAIVFVIAIYTLKTNRYPFIPEAWVVWLPLAIALVTDITMTLALQPRTYVQSTPCRNTFLILMAIVWLVSPSFRLNRVTTIGSRYGIDPMKIWSCGSTWCDILLALDVLGFIAAFLIVVEMFLAHRYERSAKQTPVATFIVTPDAPQHYIPMHQPVTAPYQPGYPQASPAPYPAAAHPYPYQAPVSPYQAPGTTYQAPGAGYSPSAHPA